MRHIALLKEPMLHEPVESTNLALHKTYKISVPPESDYPDLGGELTDGIYGTTDFMEASWQGHSGKVDRKVIIDLETPSTIAAIKANFLEDIGSSIFAPDMLGISVSIDGENWSEVAVLDRLPACGSEAKLVSFHWSAAEHGVPDGAPVGSTIYARYVKIHAIVNVWLFMDEIEVWGVAGKQAGAVELMPGKDQGPETDYLRAGEATGGIRDLMLFYNGQYPNDAGNWSAAQFLPYVAYVDQQGAVQEWLFDGGVFLALYSDKMRSFMEDPGAEPSRMEDWQWYLNKTFYEQSGDAAQLNEAVKQAKAAIGEHGYKMKVVFMIPFPSSQQMEFGDVDGDGVSENFCDPQSGQAARERAIQWYISELNAKWEQAQYAHLELVGFYWLQEAANPDDLALLDFTSNLTRSQGAKLFWIPYFNAASYYKWNKLGIDAMAYQPNHYFNAGTTADRIEEAARMAKLAGSGIEIELDERAFQQPALRQKYIDYLQGTIAAGITPDVFKAYYQGVRTFYQAAYDADPRNRQLYDWIYDYVRGHLI
ncbi:DUF4855 domain-containing protein [Paenibacillus sp. GXUN7292]|uniref:DUF4855 domain-containing protein n=1 Tax=Paenibacillus sp. GXUN7292 TaxID=3422499 RepID=UPI003D7E6BCB